MITRNESDTLRIERSLFKLFVAYYLLSVIVENEEKFVV